MTHSHGESTSPAESSAEVVEELRARGGHVSGPLAGTPLMLVRHAGARSGIERIVPLAYLPRPDGQFVIIASDGGSPRHPAWYHNLKANPEITVEAGAETFRAVARELDRAARSVLRAAIVEQAPAAGELQKLTTRTIPVFILTRQG